MASGSGWNLWVWLAGGGCGWNLWVWLLGVVVRRYIDFLILLIPTPLVSAFFLQQHPYFLLIFLNRMDRKALYSGQKSSKKCSRFLGYHYSMWGTVFPVKISKIAIRCSL